MSPTARDAVGSRDSYAMDRLRRARQRAARRRRSALVFAIIFVILGAAAFIVAHVVLTPHVPVLHGLTLPRAQTELAMSGLTTGRITYDSSSTEPTWTVIRQTSGAENGRDRSVDLVLAGGPPVRVPTVIGMTVSEGVAALRAAGLATPTIEYRFDDAAPAHATMSQEPTAGALVESGTAVVLVASRGPQSAPTDTVPMKLVTRFGGPSYSPKSVVATQRGLVFAQNMIYRHTISVFDDTTHGLVKTIPDRVTLSQFGFPKYASVVRGGPVEAAATPDGKYMYVSQYSMYGPGFPHPGDDDLGPGSGVDPSFVYRVSTESLEIDQVIEVGSVPKYIAVTSDGRYVLVTNWVSFTLSVIDASAGRVVKTISLGRHPRGIAVDSASETAYVAIMGGSDIAKVRLSDFHVSWIKRVGSSPRHLVISPDDRYLYATLNGSGQVVKIDLAADKIVDRVNTGSQPRSMAISGDGRSLYVVNYESDSVSKVRAEDMTEIHQVAVGHHPIGITYVNARREIWVCCYSGVFYVFGEPRRLK